MHSSTVRTCLCCPTETSRPDQRTATLGLRSFLHVDTGTLSRTTTGMSTPLTHERNNHGETSAIPAYKDVSATNARNRAEHQDHGETRAILAQKPYPHTGAHSTAHGHQNHEETSTILAHRRIRTPTRTAHLGPDDRARKTAGVAESPANQPSTDITVLLIHTGHDVVHFGPVVNRREHRTRRIITSKSSTLYNCPSGPNRP